MMESITLSLVARGPRILALPDGRLCKSGRFFAGIIHDKRLTRCSINWYQRNYPFVWAGARLVKDA